MAIVKHYSWGESINIEDFCLLVFCAVVVVAFLLSGSPVIPLT
jgi:hypothetical protein